ncbi:MULTISPECIES: RraA family protein [unclassified Microcella]|uniref:RraA family protein n=1 Tax=unclassified Microcella TaxID=2630066 RepID=UPI0006FB980E|nr:MULTISPECIES: RraA family protein [unclassified Microcella]KQV24559.1 hypothetical protein ASC54_08470 [Yonghaparkia sp. Root332]KRF30852.1 hypothetical protein ASG83_08300 [Yonghaparkia sp. Soil809]
MSGTTALPTAAVVDALVRLGLPAPAFALRPIAPGRIVAGPAAPVTHLGSVDVILEVIGEAPTGSVLVVDNGGRDDEACVGDLLALEAHLAGLAGIVIDGFHRDSAQLVDIGIPIFSRGAFPRGPVRVPPAAPPMRSATIGGVTIRPGDIITADDDGVVVVAAALAEEVGALARRIMTTEVAQAERMRAGESLRSQLAFDEYLALRAENPGYSLRDHLAARGGAIET